MITEKVMIVAIICATIAVLSLIGSVCDVIKKKGKDKHERTDSNDL